MTNYTVLLFDKSATLENKIITKDYIFNNIVIDMQERDLHIIDPTNKSHISVLLIKKYCILIKLDYLRCILTPDKVYIFSISDSRCRKFLEFLRKHYLENEEVWSITNNQITNLKKRGKYFDHYQYYDNNDEKITQKDCVSNRFV